MPSTKISTWAADGSRLRAYTVERIEHLEQLSKVVVIRNRKGKILRAIFRDGDGANPLRATANMGQRYYFAEKCGNHRVWSHTPLVQRQDLEQVMGEKVESEEDLDLYLRRVFRAVPLSCLKEEPKAPEPPKTPAKVVNIADFRQRRHNAKVSGVRPIEFDSEKRAA